MFKIVSYAVKLFYCITILSLTACGGGGSSSNTTAPTTPTPPPTSVTLSSISLSTVDQTLKVPENVKIIATGVYSDGSSDDISSLVSWSSNDTDTLEVSTDGTVSARAAGVAIITASLDGISAQQSISVKQLTKLSISPSSVSIPVSSSETLSVVGIYSDDSTETFTSGVNLSSADENIASIINSNEIQGLQAGSTSISATVQNISATINIQVLSATLQSIEILAEATEAPEGTNIQFLAQGTYSDGSKRDLTTQALWSVSNEARANIDSANGLLSAISQGPTVVSVSKDEISASTNVIINEARLIELNVLPASLSIAAGSDFEVSVIGIFSNNTTVDLTEQAQWQILDENLARFDANSFTFEALSAGDTELIASVLGAQASASLNIIDTRLVQIAISEFDTLTLPSFQSRTFQATGIFADGSTQDISNQVTWLSSNEDSLIISNAEQNKGFARTLNIGVAEISAVLDGVRSSATIEIIGAALIQLEIQLEDEQLSRGSSTAISVLGTFSDGSRLDLSSEVTFSASENRLVNLQFANAGIIRARNQQGSVVISATLSSVVAIAELTISDALLENITIEAAYPTLPVGFDMQLKAIGRFSDGSVRDISDEVVWQVDSAQRATVSNDAPNSGLISASDLGDVNVTASSEIISGEIGITIIELALARLEVSTTASQMNIRTSQQAIATAIFTDGSRRDVSSQVFWSSDNSNIAWVSNKDRVGGLITALSAGETRLQANFQQISSNAFLLNVSADANAATAIVMSAQPNIILNNGVDATEITVRLLPSSINGTVPDGSPITLFIIEGEQERSVELTTVDGEASHTIQSDYNGFISLEASSAALNTTAGIISTTNLSDALSGNGLGRVDFENGVLKAESVFLVLLNNLTNREFSLSRIEIGYLDPQDNDTLVLFPDSTITDPALLSDGQIKAGEFHTIGYSLEEDTTASQYQISYFFTEPLTGQSFKLDAKFTFRD